MSQMMSSAADLSAVPANDVRQVTNMNVAFINRSSIVSDPEAQAVMAALQIQVSRDFAPVWGVDAQLIFVGQNDSPPPGYWWLLVLDDSDQAGDLGYHDLTEEGLPLGKVFAKTDQVYKTQWSVTASHELLEMLIDPYINLAAIHYPGENNTYMSLYAYEVCDPCEADRYGYTIDGILVSDFVYPTWFEQAPRKDALFDFKSHIAEPLYLLPGGYISVYDVQFGAGWVQKSGDDNARTYSSRAQVGSRRERRRVPRKAWQISTPRSSIPMSQVIPAFTQLSRPVPSRPNRPNALQRARRAAFLNLQGSQQHSAKMLVAADREERYRAYLAQMPNPTEPPKSPARAATAATTGKQPLRILAEGDSWFDYPLPPSYGVIYELQSMLGYPIANMAVAGEEVRQMLGLSVRQEIIKRLADYGNIRYDAMLFSGGGDDLVGDALATFLNTFPPAVPPTSMLNDTAVKAALDLLGAEYRELIAIRDRYNPGTRILVNCYDFPPITGIGVCTKGPWLKPSLDYAYQQTGVASPDPNVEFLVVRQLLQRFRAMLVDIANDPKVKDFYVIETQDTLLANNSDWANELHPTQAGFRKIAAKFRDALGALFP